MRRLCLILLAAGCEDVAEPYELDHARIVAVRIDPPAFAPGDRARIDVLVTDASAGLRAATPDAFVVSSPYVPITRELDAWYVAAPVDAPHAVVPLELVVDSDEGPLVAQKTLEIGMRAENPVAPVILQDGAPAPMAMTSGRAVQLAVSPHDPALSYRWFSSVGDVTGYQRPEAELDPTRAALGTIGVVVRDQRGGTAWTFVAVEVQ